MNLLEKLRESYSCGRNKAEEEKLLYEEIRVIRAGVNEKGEIAVSESGYRVLEEFAKLAKGTERRIKELSAPRSLANKVSYGLGYILSKLQ